MPPPAITPLNLINPFISSLARLENIKNINDIQNIKNIEDKLQGDSSPPMIAAKGDLEAIATWLTNFQGHTFHNYRREAERFFLWLNYNFPTPKLLKDVRLEDIQQYQNFCQNPQPTDFWCMPAKYPRQHANWRPFYKPLQGKSLALSLNILTILFNWLQRAAYLKQNPFSLLPKKKMQQNLNNKNNKNNENNNDILDRLDRYIPEILWEAIEEIVEKNYQQAEKNILADDSSSLKNLNINHINAFKKAIRQKWLLSLFYQTGLRISEAIENNMSGFEVEYIHTNTPPSSLKNEAESKIHHEISSEILIWLRVIGKGGKIRKIPIPHDFLKILALYRSVVLKIDPLPAKLSGLQIKEIDVYNNIFKEKNINNTNIINDAITSVSLVAHIKANKIVSPHRSSLHNEIKEIFKDVYLQIMNDHDSNFTTAQQVNLQRLAPILLKASAHWIRHSIWTHMANHNVDLRVIRDNAGHASIATTNIYLHSEEKQRHELSVNFKKTKPSS